MVLDYKGRNDIGNWTCINYRACEISVHRGGGVRFDQAQDQQMVTTLSLRIVTECLITRSMLIKMYVYAIYIRFRIGLFCVS